MAPYKGIKGVKVQSKASDPTASEATGTVWYNTASTALKYAIQSTGAWASGGNLQQARSQASGIGTPSAALAVNGNAPPYSVNSETYDGTSWSEGNNSNTASRNGRGTGTTTAAMAVGGWSSGGGVSTTQYYDGTSWTDQTGSLNRGGAKQSFGIAGASQTSAMIFGGEPGTGHWTLTEEWNGTSWAAKNTLNSGRQGPVGTGIVTAALCVAGIGPPPANTTNVESYNGTSWSETTDINTARWGHGSNGTTALGMIYGGTPPTTGATESWDESSWTEVADMSTARFNSAQSQSPTNTNVAAFVAGGNTYTTATEEWEVAVTASSFTSS